MTVERVVVVGGGLAGVSAARELRDRGYDGLVTLIDKDAHPYDRPPLSKDFLLGKITEDELGLAKPAWYDDASIDLRTGVSAVALKSGAGAVELSDGSSVRADAVILALGADARPLGDAHAPHVHVLRTLADARALREKLVSGARLAIVGGGLIGAEVASSARALGVEVELIEPVDPPLTPAVGIDLARDLHRMHVESGIRLHSSGVREIRSTAGCVVVELTDGTTVTADDVLVGIGSVPVTELATDAGLEVDGGIIVDSAARTSNPAVFAAGDSARTRLPDGSLLRRKEHWEAAKFGGQAAAAAVLGEQPASTSADWFWSDRHGVHVEGVGSMTAQGTTILRPYRDDDSGRTQMAFNVRGETLLGAAAIDGGLAVRAARRLIDKGTAISPEDLADPAFDLKRLRRS